MTLFELQARLVVIGGMLVSGFGVLMLCKSYHIWNPGLMGGLAGLLGAIIASLCVIAYAKRPNYSFPIEQLPSR